MSHTCPGPGCSLLVVDRMLACKRHWFQVPEHLRRRVWDAWGLRVQHAEGPGSAQAMAAHQEAMDAAVATMKP